MSEQIEARVSRIIEAYFNLTRAKYAEIVSEVRMSGGLTPTEVRTLMDRLPFIHSNTIIRQSGLCGPSTC